MKKFYIFQFLLILCFFGCQKDNSLLLPEHKNNTENMLWNIGVQHNEILKSGLLEIDNYLKLKGKKATDLTANEFYELTFVYAKKQVKNLNEFKDINLENSFNVKIFNEFYFSYFNNSIKKSSSSSSDTSLQFGPEIIDSLVHKFNLPKKYANTFKDVYNITSNSVNVELDLKTYINTITNDDTLKNYTIAIATIANSSTQFWKNYFNQGGGLHKTDKVLLAPWVAADLIGGAAGGIGVIITEWGNINWWHVGGVTLVDAAGASLFGYLYGK